MMRKDQENLTAMQNDWKIRCWESAQGENDVFSCLFSSVFGWLAMLLDQTWLVTDFLRAMSPKLNSVKNIEKRCCAVPRVESCSCSFLTRTIWNLVHSCFPKKKLVWCFFKSPCNQETEVYKEEIKKLQDENRELKACFFRCS